MREYCHEHVHGTMHAICLHEVCSNTHRRPHVGQWDERAIMGIMMGRRGLHQYRELRAFQHDMRHVCIDCNASQRNKSQKLNVLL